MREIKFRAYIKETGKIHGVSSINFYAETAILQKENYIFPYDLGQIVLMQFTGLKDKNGKEIYEGDIIETELDYTKYVVTWDKDQVMYLLDSPEITSYLAKDIVGDVEVIGNIHENSKLIKE